MEQITQIDVLLQKLITILEFINPNEKQQWFSCMICNEVGIHHFAHNCLHIVCKQCRNDVTICPVCKSEISASGLTVVTQIEDIKKVHVLCPIKMDGCLKSGSIFDIVEHIKGCHATEMEELFKENVNVENVQLIKHAPIKSMDEMEQMLKDFQKSLKEAKENISDLQNNMGILENAVENERKERIKLQNVVQKINTMSTTDVQQDAFQAAGGQTFYSQLFDQSGYCEENLRNELKINTQLTQKDSTTHIWEIPDFIQILQDLKNHKFGEYSSSMFTTNDYGFKMRANLCFHNPYEYISIFLGFVKEDSANIGPIPPVYYHRRTVILKDQSSNSIRRDVKRVYEPGFGKKDAEMWMKGFYGWWMFAPIKFLLNENRYIKNDTAVIKIIIEPLVSIYRNFSSNVGVLFWKIENYAQAKEDEIDEVLDCLRSDYFYTSKTGYRMQVRIHLNGWKEGKGTYTAIFLWFQKGQFDDTLSEKIHYRLTCRILDQTISFNKQDLVKSTERMDDRLDVGYGFSDFALQATVEQALYLRNDTLSLKVFVEML